jgi:DNA-binding NtrC family response regulator
MIRAILYSDDFELQRLFVRSYGDMYEVAQESDENVICKLLNSEKCDAVYCDISSKNGVAESRINFAKKLIASSVWLTVIADDLTGEAAMSLVKLGADGYRRKSSFRREMEIIADSRNEVESSLLAQNTTWPVHLNQGRQLVGSSLRMRQILGLIRRIADLSASVLITGETGTGKELVARMIHASGCRADRPFVAISCSAIPETLLEAELFGHEKGAFTGSIGAREGYFERAGAGTLFLDEVGDLNLSAQVKLLRVLQERSFCRIGSSRAIPLKARLLFATHRDLTQMMKDGLFRTDLFYRMNVVRIETPSLREHPEDIAELATQFVHRYSREFGRSVSLIGADALAALTSYHWPGNVRELENVIQQVVAISSGSSITKEMLPAQIVREEILKNAICPTPRSLEEMLLHEKVKLAIEALRRFAGNKSHAARSLGISRPYFYKLIQQAGGECMGSEEV